MHTFGIFIKNPRVVNKQLLTIQWIWTVSVKNLGWMSMYYKFQMSPKQKWEQILFRSVLFKLIFSIAKQVCRDKHLTNPNLGREAVRQR